MKKKGYIFLILFFCMICTFKDYTNAYTITTSNTNKVDTNTSAVGTLQNGEVFVDKSVNYKTVTLDGNSLNSNDYIVQLSSLSQQCSDSQKPIDVVFALDVTLSTANPVVGYTQGQDMRNSAIDDMILAMNVCIDDIMEANEKNRVEVITFAGHQNVILDNGTRKPFGEGFATVMLPLDHYENPTWTNSAAYTSNYTPAQVEAQIKAGNYYGGQKITGKYINFYESSWDMAHSLFSGSKSAFDFLTNSTLREGATIIGGEYTFKLESNAGLVKGDKTAFAQVVKYAGVSGTYTQIAMMKAGSELYNLSDTNHNQIVVLLTDGYPNLYEDSSTKDYTKTDLCTNDYIDYDFAGVDPDGSGSFPSNGNSYTDLTFSTSDASVMMTLTSASWKEKLKAKYGNDSVQYYNIGLGVNTELSRCILDPNNVDATHTNEEAIAFANRIKQVFKNGSTTLATGTVITNRTGTTDYKYATYNFASDSASLTNIFKSMLAKIISNACGDIQFVDTIDHHMEFKSIIGVIKDGVLYNKVKTTKSGTKTIYTLDEMPDYRIEVDGQEVYVFVPEKYINSLVRTVFSVGLSDSVDLTKDSVLESLRTDGIYKEQTGICQFYTNKWTSAGTQGTKATFTPSATNTVYNTLPTAVSKTTNTTSTNANVRSYSKNNGVVTVNLGNNGLLEVKVSKDYDITTSIANGTITETILHAPQYSDQTIEFAADDGYYIKSIIVDGVAETIRNDRVDSYDFSMIQEDHEIKVECVPIPAKVITKHIDAVTKEEIATQDTKDGFVKDDYTTSSKSIPGYVLSVTPNNATGKMTEEDTVVVYEYLKQADVIAKYVDENTGAEISTQEKNTYKQGDSYTTTQKTIDSYTYTRVEGKTSGTVGRDTITVTYYYKKGTGVVAKFVDKTTREEIADAVPQTGLVGDNYTTSKKTIDGYTYVSVVGNETGKMTEAQITVTYEYLKNANVITKYIDENTGAEISTQNKDTYKEGDKYTTVKKDITGYTYTSSEGVTAGTIGREDITVIYKYKQNTGIVVKYIDQITREEIADATSQAGLVGQDYTTEAKRVSGYTLSVTPNNAAGKMTESQITIVYEYLKNTDVVTKHIDQVTKEEIANSSKEVGLQGQEYTTSSKDIDGYELVVTPNNASGTMAATETVVTYEYRKLADVITKYVDENTGAEISSQTVLTYKEGDNYTTTQKTITGYTYTKSEGQTSGTMGRENITVTYYYKKATGVTAIYVDKATGAEIDSREIKTGLQGDDYTTTQKTITGYTYVSVQGEPTGKMGAENITITYEYLKNADVITKYVDENTGLEISDKNQDTYKEGDNYTTVKKDITGYTYTTVEGEPTGTIGRENITVTYKYKQNTGVITKFVDKMTGDEIADQDNQAGLVGQDYTTEAKEIAGYTLFATPDNSTGKMKPTTITVVYEYLKNTDVVTKHIDQVTKQEIAESSKEDGVEGQDYNTMPTTIDGYTLVLTPANANGKMAATETVVTYEYLKNTSVTTKHIDQVTKEEIATSTTKNGLEGDEYKTTSTTVTGYTLVVTPSNANGNMTANPITVTYEYLKNTGVVTKFIDQTTGEEIATAESQTGLQGADYITTAKTIDGYELVVTPENATGKMGADTITVIYEYRKLADVITRYIDENTGAEITAHDSKSYKEGSEYTTDKKEIAGYTYTKSEGETSGTIGRENVEVKYYYKKTSAGVVVNYIDQVTGSSVATPESLAGLENDPYTTEAKEVDGYTLVVIPENKEGNMTVDTTVVTYEYLKIVKVTTKYIDLNTNEELDDQVVDTYLQGDIYNTIRKNFEGYQFMMDTANVAGIMGDKDIEVIYYYRPISSGVIIKYVDKENEELLQEDSVSGLIGDNYSTEQLTFEDYNFVEVIGQTEGTLQKDPIEVTYYYIKKRGNVVVSYITEDGEELFHDEMEGYVKENWKHEEQEIYGYEIIERPEANEGIFVEGQIDLVYVLRRLKGTITVKFKDVVGNVLAEEEFAIDFVGEDFNLDAPEIEGYKIIENGKVELKFIDGEIIVDVIYDKIPETGDINVGLISLATIIFALSLVIVTKKTLIKNK